MDEAVLARVEQQRLELEDQVATFKKSLRHWQVLETDYEGIKEEMELAGTTCPVEESYNAAARFPAGIVDESELRSFFGQDKGIYRSPGQVIDILCRRIDFSLENVSIIKKKLSDAEKKRNALLLAEEPDYRDEAGLPLMEITEELDQAGNVLSGEAHKPLKGAPRLVETLMKAGVKGLEEQDGQVRALDGDADESARAEVEGKRGQYDHKAGANGTTTFGVGDSGSQLASNTREDTSTQTAEEADVSSQSANSEGDSSSDGHTDSTKLSADDGTVEIAETAETNRDNIDYALTEIGPIVAQLDVEEERSDMSLTDDELENLSMGSDFDDDLDDEEGESEDEYGMTKRPFISDEYRRQMEELEKKLNSKAMHVVGPNPDLPADMEADLNRPTPAEAARKAAIARAEAASVDASTTETTPATADKPSEKSKKRVAFADSLDIAPETTSTKTIEQSADTKSSSAAPLPVSEAVLERSPATSTGPTSQKGPGPAKKMSRFKSDRAGQSTHDTAAAPPSKSATNPMDSQMFSDTIVEQSLSARTPAPDPEQIDETLQQQQLATEYHRLRTKMIQQQGGFVGDGEADNYGEPTAPLEMVDEETGEAKKVSRFKAARLK